MDFKLEIENIGRKVDRRFKELIDRRQDNLNHQDVEEFCEVSKTKLSSPTNDLLSDTGFQKGLVEIFKNTNFSGLESIIEINNMENINEVIPDAIEDVTDTRKQNNSQDLNCKEYLPCDSRCIKLKRPRQKTLSYHSEDSVSFGFTDSSRVSFSSDLTYTPRQPTRRDKHIKEKIITTSSKKKNHCIKLHIPKYALQMEICLESSLKKNENSSDPKLSKGLTTVSQIDATIKPALQEPISVIKRTLDNLEMPTNDTGKLENDMKYSDVKKIIPKGIYVESERCPKVKKDLENILLEPNILKRNSMTRTQMIEYIEKAQCIVHEIEHSTTSLNEVLAQLKSICNPAEIASQ